MEGFTFVDAGVGGIVLISAVLAFSRGFVREALAIAGWMLAASVAFVFAPQAEPLVKEIPVVGEFLSDSCELAILGAFAAVFAVALIVVSIFTPLFSSLVQKSALGGFDQGIGFLFGVIRGTILVAVAFVLYDRIVTAEQGFALVDDSRTAAIFAESKDVIEKQIPTQAPEWIVLRYEQLTGNCTPNSGAPGQVQPSGTSGA